MLVRNQFTIPLLIYLIISFSILESIQVLYTCLIIILRILNEYVKSHIMFLITNQTFHKYAFCLKNNCQTPQIYIAHIMRNTTLS